MRCFGSFWRNVSDGIDWRGKSSYDYTPISYIFRSGTYCEDCSRQQLLNNIDDVHCYFQEHNKHSCRLHLRHQKMRNRRFDEPVMCWESLVIVDYHTSDLLQPLMSYPFLLLISLICCYLVKVFLIINFFCLFKKRIHHVKLSLLCIYIIMLRVSSLTFFSPIFHGFIKFTILLLFLLCLQFIKKLTHFFNSFYLTFFSALRVGHRKVKKKYCSRYVFKTFFCC